MTKTAVRDPEPEDWHKVAIEAWARSEARVKLLRDWIDGMPMETATGSQGASRSPVELLLAAEDQADRRRLGLD